MDNDKVDYWIDIAEYDLETARAMLKSKRYLYVGFMCHQVVEKILKALYVKNTNQIPPYIHNLKKLSDGCEVWDLFSKEQVELIANLQPLNIEGRYPMYKEQISKTLDKKECEVLIKNTKEFLIWIKKKLEE